MAFSAFRLMMGAGQSSGPTPLTDVLVPEVGRVTYNTSTEFANGAQLILSNSSSSNIFAVFGDSNNKPYILAIQRNSGAGPTVNVGSGFQPINIGGTRFCGDMIAADNALIASYQTNSTTVYLRNVTVVSNNANSAGSGLLSASANPANIAYCNLDATNGVAFIAHSDNTSEWALINPATPVTTSQGTGPSNVTTSSISAIALSSTLGVAIYIDSVAQLLELSSIDRSGTSITLTTGVSSGVTIGSGDGKGIFISSTQILLYYYKTTNTIGARVVDCASGNTFTFHTEYTVTVPGLAAQRVGQGCRINGGDFAIPINSNGQGGVVLASISGTVITFTDPSTSINLFDSTTMLDQITPAEAYAEIVNYSTSKTMVGYSIYANNNGPYGRIVTMNLNPGANPTWSGTYAGNIQTPSTALTLSAATTGFDSVSLGTDYSVAISTNGSVFYCYQNFLDYAQSFDSGATNSFTAAGTVGTACGANVGISGSTQRLLIAYGFSGSTVNVKLLNITNQNNGSFTAATTVDTSVSTTSAYTINIIPYAADKTLVLTARSNGIYASIVTTSGLTISSATTPTSIYTATPGTFTIGWAVLDTSNVMLSFNMNSGTTIDLMILNISGSSFTPGTIVSTGTAVATSSVVSIAKLSAGVGIVSYVDTRSGNTDVFSYGFTYSGTTITLGASNTISSSHNAVGTQEYKSQLAPLNSTESLLVYKDGGGLQYRLLTYNNVNSVTASSATSANTASHAGFLAQDNYDKLTAYTLPSTSTTNFNYVYRV